MDQVLQDVPGARAYQDDILIDGPTKADHDKRLCLVQQRLTQFNLKPCSEKSVYCVTKVHFLRFLLKNGQVKPDPQWLAALKIPSPKNKQQLRSALGTLLCYCKFLQNFSSMAAPLFDLLKKDARFLWTRQHENTFRQLISAMVKATNLCIFDSHKPLFLTCDGSATGIGALLTHDKNQTEIIQCASRKLLPVDRHYSNIEREGLAIIYGINKFRNYLSSREFTIVSDHAPLKHIFDNSKAIRENSGPQDSNGGKLRCEHTASKWKPARVSRCTCPTH